MKLLPDYKTKKLRYEFLPAVEEIVESPPSPLGHIVLWLTIALLFVALAWSYFGKIDVIATAQGRVVPDGNVKVVQPAVQGTIKTISVTEGQAVKRGDVLIELDMTIAQAAVNSAERSLLVAKLERDVLKKIENGEDADSVIAESSAPQDIKDDLLGLAQSKQSATGVRRQLLSISISQAKNELGSEQQTQQGMESSLEQAKNSATQIEQQIAQASSDSEKLRLQVQLQDVNAQISSLQSSVAAQKQRVSQAQSSISDANVSLQSYNAETDATNYSNVIDQDKKIVELEDTLLKARDELAQHTLTAPVDGTVLSLATKTVGGVVSPSQTVATIVPNKADLVVEADVSTSDIGFIKVGQKVAIKVDTYSFQRYGYLDGTVEKISADSVVDDKKGSIYKAVIKIDSTKTSKDTSLTIIPGMTLTNEITTGQRRIIDFLLDPLIGHVDESLKVR